MALKSSRIYQVRDDSSEEVVAYAVSPDSVGLIWYDTLHEVHDDYGAYPVVSVSRSRLEEIRG